jgi:hypothetical protein
MPSYIMRVVGRRREAPACPTEGGETLFVRAPHVVERREHRADRFRHGTILEQLIVTDAERVRPVDFHVDMIAIAGEAGLVV